MIIVRDIQDAMTMKKKLSSLVRRSVNFDKDKKDILDKNVEREELALDAEFLEAV